MRVINYYSFKTGTKFPFSELPSIIHTFFEKSGTAFGAYLYCFKDLDFMQRDLSRSGCGRILKDCPRLGKIRYFEGKKIGIFDEVYLSNIDDCRENLENDLLPLMKKIHRNYGFSDSDIFYYDVNFFGKVLPYGRDLTVVKERYKETDVLPDDHYCLELQPYGSGIHIHRDISGASLVLTVDILHDGKMYDPTAYVHTMKELLPGVKCAAGQRVFPDQKDRAETEKSDRAAAALLEEARSAYRYPEPEELFFAQNFSSPKYSLAPKMKKAAKQRGYTYHSEGNFEFVFEKRTGAGPIIQLGALTGPHHCNTDLWLTICGVGYTENIIYRAETPDGQEELDACIDRFFADVDDFEKRFYPELSKIYPTAPDWLIPDR